MLLFCFLLQEAVSHETSDMKSGTSEVTGTSNVSLFMVVSVISCYYVSEHTRDFRKSFWEICNDKLFIEVFF
jgi:hypothetical protein